jgi:L-rhamnose mutarotase
MTRSIKKSTMMNGPSSANTRFAAVFMTGIGAGIFLVIVIQKNRMKRKHTGIEQQLPAPRRFAGAIKLLPHEYQRYRHLHDNVWPHVSLRMCESNIRNFSIFYHEETSTLFQYFEWIGHLSKVLTRREEQALFEKDMEAISSDPVTQKWWMECEPCQEPFSQWLPGSLPLSQGGKGDWWAPMECVCHCGYWPTQYGNISNDPDFVKLI